jgi:hypothetical protein
VRQELLDEWRVGPPEKALGGGRAVGAEDMEVVDGGEGGELAIAEPVTAVVLEREVTVAPFHAGAAALEQVGAALGDLLDACTKRGREVRPDLGEAGGDLRHGLYLAAVQVVGVKQGPQRADRGPGLALALDGLGLLGLRPHQVAHGRGDARREGRGPTAGTGRGRVIGPRGRALHLQVRRDRGVGVPDLAGQVQTGALGDLLLAMKEIRDVASHRGLSRCGGATPWPRRWCPGQP